MKSTSDERYQPFLENRKHTALCHWISRAERGNYNQSKANWSPQRQEDLGPVVLWEAGQDGAWEKPVVFYSISISHPVPYMLTLLPSSENTESSECDGVTCDSEEDTGIESGKIGADTGKQGMEV